MVKALHQVVALFKFLLVLLTTVELTAVVVFSVGVLIILVKVLLQVEPLLKFQLEVITPVPLMSMVVYSVGDLMSMTNPPHLPISELGTVLNDALHPHLTPAES